MKKQLLLILLIMALTGCKVKEYTVTFNTDGGTQLESVKIKSGESLGKISPPVKEGYIFVGWTQDGITYNDNAPINEDIDLTASWTEAPDLTKEYKVIFSFGEEKQEVTVTGKTKVAKPNDPSVKYYKFAGWYNGDELYDFDSPVTKDLYLVAKFEKKVVKITFDLNGGSGISERQIDAGKKLNRPDDPIKFGFKFIGWYYLGKEYNFDSPIEKAITLTAKWEPINYVTVKFVNENGEVLQSEAVEKGKTVTKPTNPVKEGYIFDYWAYNGESYSFDSPVNESISLVAVFKAPAENNIEE